MSASELSLSAERRPGDGPVPWQFSEGRIAARRILAGEYVHVTIFAPTVSSLIGPGQFVMVRAKEWGQLLLNRPFDVYASDPQTGTFELLFKIKGEGTRRLARLGVGDTLRVLGPLGQPIPIERFPAGIGLVGRGAGVSPMVKLAQACHRASIPTYALVSARSKQALLGVEDLHRYARQIVTLTDDGEGQPDPVAVIEKWAAGTLGSPPVQAIYTCGSRRLGRAVRDVSARYGTAGFIFMEAHMGCGIGTCHGCAVPIRHDATQGVTYPLACVDGPAFPIDTSVF